jgi:geranylgeranyl diphosphate synthase type I
VTGKPSGADLLEHKATSVVVAAHQLADTKSRRQLRELMSANGLTDTDLRRWRALIVATGAVELIEQQIDSRLTRALDWVTRGQISPMVRTMLAEMATACAQRAA